MNGSAWLLSALLMCFSGSAWADMKFVTIGKIAPVQLKPGKPNEAVVPVIVEKDLHVQANPASTPQLIATKLEVSELAGIKPGTPTYPAGKPYKLQGAASEISVYDGQFVVKLPLFAQASAKAGKHQLQGKLKFQACNDKICFFPTNVPVTIPVTVQK